ncbi:hypothetical protein F4811DRAFT_569424 [Daldinia bambusicola]|nr:hypothetical protein F4811DRAFT_569424 [Daldinia bambusicola]
MGSARDHVFGVAELLGIVLSFLGNRDLLVNVQRVSKRWRDVIQASPMIQKSLFLRPTLTPWAPHQVYTINCLCTAIIPVTFTILSVGGGTWRYIMPYVHLSTEARAQCWTFEFIRKWFVDNASWRRMLVSQPPIKTVYWNISSDGQPGTRNLGRRYSIQLEFPEGLRMGEFCDFALGGYIIEWPYMDASKEGSPFSNEIAKFYGHFEHEEHAIIVKQVARTNTVGQETYPRVSDLRKYHNNIKKILVRTRGSSGYMELAIDSASALELFLEAAQARLPQGN